MLSSIEFRDQLKWEGERILEKLSWSRVIASSTIKGREATKIKTAVVEQFAETAKLDKAGNIFNVCDILAFAPLWLLISRGIVWRPLHHHH